MYSCCSKIICNGCNHANKLREYETRLDQKCLFCREPTSSTDEQLYKRRMKRVEMNDTDALSQEGLEQYKKGNHAKAFEYWKKAADLGDVEAHKRLGNSYHDGLGVEKDIKKEIYHLEEAAIGGHPGARYNLGWHENENGNAERAVKHYVIAATQGEDSSIKMLMKYFKAGYISKEDLASALRAHQTAVDATKSSERNIAEEYKRIVKEKKKHSILVKDLASVLHAHQAAVDATRPRRGRRT